MTEFNTQKAEKLTVEDLAHRLLNGNLLKEFGEFLDFLKEEGMRVPWASINAFNINYKGKRAGYINIHKINCVGIKIPTAEPYEFDNYFWGQPDEIIDVFIKNINMKCTRCYPGHGSGMTVTLFGKQYENYCFNRQRFHFISSGDNMRTLTLLGPNTPGNGPPAQSCEVSIEIVKKLILIRKEYIIKMLAAEKPTSSYKV